MDRGLKRAVDVDLLHVNMIDIQFEDIYFIVKHGRTGLKPILKNVSGKFRSGELTAIMGPSGAGKTSLLNILTGFQKTGVKGRISSSCRRTSVAPGIGCDSYKKNACYILQDDHLNPLFTVEELMFIAADLKMDQSINIKSKKYIISDILDTIGLSLSRHTRCGRLSGGQKKRLSIALELLDNPPIMFLDEPTTGLDSLSSLQCIRMLKTLAAKGRTIICTIHQPSASIYELFDHIYVIAAGRCVFQGDSSNTVPFLEKVNLPCPKYHNPADHLIAVASGDFGDCLTSLVKEAHEPQWRSNEISHNIYNQINQTILNDDIAASGVQQIKKSGVIDQSNILLNPPSEFYKFKILLRKSYLLMFRDWTYIKLILHIVVATLIGFNFFNMGNNGHKLITNMGYMMVTLIYLNYTSMMPAVLKFPLEITILRKEHFNNWYQLKTYYAAYIFSAIPIEITFVLAYCTISYILTGQIMELERCCQFIAIVIICTLIAEGIGMFFGTIVNPVNGTFLSSIILSVFISISGFFMPFSEMSPIWYAVSYISYMAYGMNAFMQAIYGRDRPNLTCPSHYEYCHFMKPATILTELGVDPTGSGYWNNLAVLVGLFVMLKVLGFVTLKHRLARTV